MDHLNSGLPVSMLSVSGGVYPAGSNQLGECFPAKSQVDVRALVSREASSVVVTGGAGQAYAAGWQDNQTVSLDSSEQRSDFIPTPKVQDWVPLEGQQWSENGFE